MNIELMASGTLNHSWMKLTQPSYFLCKPQPSPPELRNRQHISATFGAILNPKMTKEKHTNVKKKVAQRQSMKKTPVRRIRAKTGRWSITSLNLSWERAPRRTQRFCCYAHVRDHKRPRKCYSIHVGRDTDLSRQACFPKGNLRMTQTDHTVYMHGCAYVCVYIYRYMHIYIYIYHWDISFFALG